MRVVVQGLGPGTLSYNSWQENSLIQFLNHDYREMEDENGKYSTKEDTFTWPLVLDTHSPGKQLTETADKATLRSKSQQLGK